MAVTASIDENSPIDRHNLGFHIARRQKLFEDIDLSISMGLNQNYQRLDSRKFITLGPAGQMDPSSGIQGLHHSYILSANTSINLSYKNITVGAMYSNFAGIIKTIQVTGSSVYWPAAPSLTAFAEADFQVSETSEINAQFHLLHRAEYLTVLSPQIRVRHKWAVFRAGYWINRTIMGGAGVHYSKNDFLLMIHRTFNGARAFGPTFEISYVRNLKNAQD